MLVAGWSAADWNVIHPLLDAGELPNLENLVNGGVSGTLAASSPFISPALWTTAVTGKPPDVHGILDWQEPDPLTGRPGPPPVSSRRVPALWNLLAEAGLRTHVIGWPVSHPAECLSGAVVSDRFAKPTAPAGLPWPVPPRAVHPVELEPELLNLRLHPGELCVEDLCEFIPGVREIDQGLDRRFVPLAVALAENATVHAAATLCLEQRDWDFAAIYYGLTGTVSRCFMRYAPPRLLEVDERDSRLYGGVVRAAYRLQDAMLGRLLELAGSDVRVVVFSEHGFCSGARRPQKLTPNRQEDNWFRPHGIFCMYGPGVRQDELVHGARLIDLAPTLLASFDLPPAEDMPGRVLADAFVSAPTLARSEKTAVAEADSAGIDEAAAAAASLAAMGYADPLQPALEEASTRAGQNRDFHLALAHLSAGRPAGAIPPLERFAAADPANEAGRLYLCAAYLLAGRLEDCAGLLERAPKDGPNGVCAELIKGRLLLVQGRASEAVRLLTDLREEADSAALQCLLGDAYQACRRPLEAAGCYRAALELDPDLDAAHVGLAVSHLSQNENRQAMEAALHATGLDYGCARAHFLLGLAWARLRRPDLAAASLEICLKLEPEMAPARRLLNAIRWRAANS